MSGEGSPDDWRQERGEHLEQGKKVHGHLVGKKRMAGVKGRTWNGGK